ncbi:flagellar motor stator protein MotA [Sulfurimonas sp. HSL-1716]|uniref:flagellar motor stator protein MotA n=1 Tax=Hydrocurvibacter sulfurireducens TaxID=3131937 RepID=UPI0031F97D34
MDLTVILGMLFAVISLSTGDILDGGNPLGLLHITSFLIVIPTALASAMTGTSGDYVKAAYRELKFVFKKSPVNFQERINQIIEFSIIARRDGLLGLEPHINNIDDEFFKKGLSMTIDGIDIDEIETTLEILIDETEEYYHGAAHYWILAGETCPVMGLIGAVMGLILALQKLNDPVAMAEGIAGAFTATVTGIAGAYMFIGPIGNKLKAKSRHNIREKQIILAGILGIASGDNPRALEGKLFHYFSPLEEKKSKFEQ